jgi:hypothetical protein
MLGERRVAGSPPISHPSPPCWASQAILRSRALRPAFGGLRFGFPPPNRCERWKETPLFWNYPRWYIFFLCL